MGSCKIDEHDGPMDRWTDADFRCYLSDALRGNLLCGAVI
jgi:hypothetical protein